MNQLLHKDEVKHKVPVAGSIDSNVFQYEIKDVEETFFNELSWDFYLKLQEDVTDEYKNAKEFVQGNQYSEGDLVIFDGFLYCAIKDTCEQPECDWELKCKFKTPCYCELWNCYLCKILSAKTLLYVSDDLNTTISNKGIGNAYSDDVAPYDYKALTQWANGRSNKITNICNNMIRFIWRAEGDCYDCLKECLPCPPECEPCGKLPAVKLDYGHIPLIGNLPDCELY